MDSAEDLLQDIETRLEPESEMVEEATGVDRREFMFMSLIAAAATTFGVPIARAQAGASAPQQPAAPAIDLGNGEPPASVFQAYPERHGCTDGESGEGARPSGVRPRNLFRRAMERRPVPTSDDEIAFLPVHPGCPRSSRSESDHVVAADGDLSHAHETPRSNAALRCHDHGGSPRVPPRRCADAEIAAGKYRGPLHGIPWGVKDLFSTKGTRTTWGARLREPHHRRRRAEVVVRLHEAGAVLMAKLATGLFANNDWWYRGRTNKPWDIKRGSSGSSGGPVVSDGRRMRRVRHRH